MRRCLLLLPLLICPVACSWCAPWVVVEPPLTERVFLNRRTVQTDELVASRLEVALEHRTAAGTALLRVQRVGLCRTRIEEAYREDSIQRFQKDPAHTSNPPQKLGERTEGPVQTVVVGSGEHPCRRAAARRLRLRVAAEEEAGGAATRPAATEERELVTDQEGGLLVDWRALWNARRPPAALRVQGEGTSSRVVLR